MERLKKEYLKEKKKLSKPQKTVDFIGVGFPKSGTTWIGDCLKEHPQILFSEQKTNKEINFFNSLDWRGEREPLNYPKGISWYLNQFPNCEKGKIRGEFSVRYIYDELALKRIKRHFPFVKILVAVRNPVDTIYSMHWFFRYSLVRKEPDDFEEAVNQGHYIDKIQPSKYLKVLYKLFSKKNVHVVIYDDLLANPELVVRRMYNFLGVDNSFVPSVIGKRINVTLKPRSDVLVKLSKIFLGSLKIFARPVYIKIIGNREIYNIYSSFVKKREVKPSYPPLSFDVRKKVMRKYYPNEVKKLEVLLKRSLSSWNI